MAGTNADCCPKHKQTIYDAFERDIMSKYEYLKREKHFKGETVQVKRSHKKDPLRQEK